MRREFVTHTLSMWRKMNRKKNVEKVIRWCFWWVNLPHEIRLRSIFRFCCFISFLSLSSPLSISSCLYFSRVMIRRYIQVSNMNTRVQMYSAVCVCVFFFRNHDHGFATENILNSIYYKVVDARVPHTQIHLRSECNIIFALCVCGRKDKRQKRRPALRSRDGTGGEAW